MTRRCTAESKAALVWNPLIVIPLQKGLGEGMKRKILVKKKKNSLKPTHMEKRIIGNTGLEVSVLGFGASPLGGAFEYNVTQEDGN